MNEVNQPQNILDTQVRQKFSSHEWVSVKNENENIKSKFYIKKEFYHEHKTNSKKLRYNKRNPTKNRNYYEQHPIYKDSKMLFGFQSSCDRIYQNSLPNSVTYKYEGLGSRIYNSNFTSDGRMLLVTTQHGTSSFKFSDDNHVEMSGMTQCPDLNWSITDSDISADNKLMVHSTLSPNIHLYDIEQGKYFDHFAIKSNQQEDSTLSDFLSFFSLRIYCLKLSSDKNQIIAGCGKTIGGAPIQVYDLEANKVKNSIVAHSDDINSITYLNKENSTMFISASDDGVSKLWDTRILENNKPVGIFYGHVSGITYVSSKEDDRYFITNCKDQSIKLWDIRKAITQKMNYPFLKFDYRYEILSAEHIEEIKKFQQKIDHATMTFWGHQVHMSLIRCHFSPLYGTAQRYIYTGSFDGRVYIYDTISGQNVMVLEQSNQESAINGSVIRDCRWHPFSQTLVSTNFLGELHRWEYLDIKDSDSMEIEHETADETLEKAEEKPEFAQYKLNDDDEPVVFERSLLRDNM